MVKLENLVLKINFSNTMSIFRKTSCFPSHQLKKKGKKKVVFLIKTEKAKMTRLTRTKKRLFSTVAQFLNPHFFFKPNPHPTPPSAYLSLLPTHSIYDEDHLPSRYVNSFPVHNPLENL